jgi:hypothetical protein
MTIKLKSSLGLLFLVMGALAIDFTLARRAMATDWKDYGNINPIGSSPLTWTCTTRTQFDPGKKIDTGIYGKVCLVRSFDGQNLQGAIIVRNYNSYLYSTGASGTLFNIDGNPITTWECPQSSVGANSWSVCFGNIFKYPYLASATGFFSNHTRLGLTPYALIVQPQMSVAYLWNDSVQKGYSTALKTVL